MSRLKKFEESIEDVQRYKQLIKEAESDIQRGFFIAGCKNILGIEDEYDELLRRAQNIIEDHVSLFSYKESDLAKKTGLAKRTIKKTIEGKKVSRNDLFQIILLLDYNLP